MVENRRVGIKSRETYECPGSLALMLAHRDLEGICLERDVQREKIRLEHRYAELVYDGLWFSPLKKALDAFVARDAALRHRRGAPAPVARLVRGRRVAAAPTASTTTAWPPTTPTTRSATRTPPASSGSGASPSRPGRAPRAGWAASRVHPLARPLRRRPRRGAAGVHREPAVRPAPRPRRPRRLAGPRPRAGPRRDPRRPRRPLRCSPPSTRSRRSWPAAPSSSCRPTRTSTPPSSGGSPSWPGPPAPSSTPAGAATTRSPPTSGCTRSGRSRPWPVRVGELQEVLLGRAEGAGDAVPARLHPPAAGPAGRSGPPPARPRLGAGPRRRPPARLPHAASTCRRSAPARWPARRCRSTPDGHRGRPRLRRRVREQPRRGVRPRLRGRGAVRPGPARRAPQPHRRGGRPLDDRGVRLRPARRRLRHGQLDAPAEEEPGHRRAGPRARPVA